MFASNFSPDPQFQGIANGEKPHVHLWVRMGIKSIREAAIPALTRSRIALDKY